MFVDVRGFTALAERLSPAEIAARLNRFYSLATETVLRHDGTLDKLVGDQIMAFFGAPVHSHDHPRRAVKAALEIMRGVSELEENQRLQVGAGIATSEAFVGNVGEGETRDYTVLGDTVNVAARLQAAAGPGEALVTQGTYDHMESEFPGAPRRELQLKGKNEPVPARVIVANRDQIGGVQ